MSNDDVKTPDREFVTGLIEKMQALVDAEKEGDELTTEDGAEADVEPGTKEEQKAIACPEGLTPITDARSLRDALLAYGDDHQPGEPAVDYIIQQAQELDLMDHLPDSWGGDEVPFDFGDEKSADDIEAKAVTDADKKAQEARSKEYKIGIKDGGNVTKPSEFKDVPDSEWGDPVNYRYHMEDKEHADDAASRWGDADNREQYTSEEQAIISRRIEERQASFGEGKKDVSEEQVDVPEVQNAAPGDEPEEKSAPEPETKDITVAGELEDQDLDDQLWKLWCAFTSATCELDQRGDQGGAEATPDEYAALVDELAGKLKDLLGESGGTKAFESLARSYVLSKAGSRHSTKDYATMDAMHTCLLDLGYKCMSHDPDDDKSGEIEAAKSEIETELAAARTELDAVKEEISERQAEKDALNHVFATRLDEVRKSLAAEAAALQALKDEVADRSAALSEVDEQFAAKSAELEELLSREVPPATRIVARNDSARPKDIHHMSTRDLINLDSQEL